MTSKSNGLPVILFSLSLLMMFSNIASAGGLSPNIPLDSYIYVYLDKLDGLGYLDDIQTGTKPYTRMQAAQWIRQIKVKAGQDPALPAYANFLLQRLEAEFSKELGWLDGATVESSFKINELSWTNIYYDGNLLAQHRNTAHHQPLYTNQNGYRLAEGLNNILTIEMEGEYADDVLFSLTPRLDYDEAEDGSSSLESGYIKTKFGNIEVQLGKDPMMWGAGKWGNFSLTNNSRPMTGIKLSNIDPVPLEGIFKVFRQMDATFFYSELEKDRSDVKEPSFVGLRASVKPTPNLTIAGSLNSIVGGEGRALESSDYWKFLIGKNAEKIDDEKWNSIAGLDCRWRITGLNDVQVYAAVYGEDQAGKIIPLPSRNAYMLGVYLPRLVRDGSWDLQLEAARTMNWWYWHYLYTNGYVYHDNIIGDAMGYNAERFNFQLTRYLTDGSRFAFRGEYLVMDKDAAAPQTVTSLWIAYSRELEHDLTLNVTAGTAEIDNLDYEKGKTDRDYLVSVGMTKRF